MSRRIFVADTNLFFLSGYTKTERPEYDGGSMVTQYEVNMINPDGSSRIAFSGYETECLVASLLPGRIYAFQVRASNRIGVCYHKKIPHFLDEWPIITTDRSFAIRL